MKISKRVRHAVFGLLCITASTQAAFASEAAAQAPVEDARAILIANNTESMIDQMFTQLVPLMESGFLGQLGQVEAGAELIKQIDAKYPGGQTAFSKRFGALIMAGMRSEYPNIIEQAAQQYVAEIQPADLAAIRIFMESSAGRSMAAAQPKLQQKLGAIGQEIGRKAGEKAAMQLMAEAGQYLGPVK